jgi:hypothetical protein
MVPGLNSLQDRLLCCSQWMALFWVVPKRLTG